MRWLRISLLAGFLVCMITVQAGMVRVWTDTSGNTVEAEAVQVEQEQVWLRTRDGRQLVVPFEEFSEEDQAVLRKILLEQTREEAMAPERWATFINQWDAGTINERELAGSVKGTYKVYVPTMSSRTSLSMFVFVHGQEESLELMKLYKTYAEAFKVFLVGVDGMGVDMATADKDLLMDAVLMDLKVNLPYSRVFVAGYSAGMVDAFRLASRRKDLEIKGILSVRGYDEDPEAYHDLEVLPGTVVAFVVGALDSAEWAKLNTLIRRLEASECTVKTFNMIRRLSLPERDSVQRALEWMNELLRFKPTRF